MRAPHLDLMQTFLRKKMNLLAPFDRRPENVRVLPVAACTFATTRATTLPLRLTAPTIGVLPEPMPPVPPPPPRLSQCRFLANPPTKVSSTSTIPPSLSMSCINAVLILWHMSQAVL